MNPNEQTRSNTGITFQIKENWFKNLDEAKQRKIMGEIVSLLAKEKIANDINGYQKHLLRLEYGVEEQWNLEM